MRNQNGTWAYTIGFIGTRVSRNRDPFWRGPIIRIIVHWGPPFKELQTKNHIGERGGVGGSLRIS